jgi:hypothetical protein
VALRLGLVAVSSRSSAGPERIVFPVKYKDGVLYTIDNRYDVKQYRQLYASAAAVRRACSVTSPTTRSTT